MIPDLAITGLITGAGYALVALGISIIFGILRIVNFAHGEFFMIGAYASVIIATLLGLPPIAGVLGAVVTGAIAALIMERLLMRPLYAGFSGWSQDREEYAIIVTFGLSLLLVSLAYQFAGPYPIRPMELFEGRVSLGPVVISAQRLAAGLIAMVTVFGLFAWFRFTPSGKRVVAVSQNKFAASLCGINPVRVVQTVFAVSGALAALAGALMAPLLSAHPEVGLIPAVKAYVVVVLGGMGSLWGGLAGALVLGLIETFGAVYLSYSMRDSFAFVLLIAVLLLKPEGLLGRKGRMV